MVVLVGGPGEVRATAGAAGKWSLAGHWEQESLSESGGSAPLIVASFLLPNMLLLLGDANIHQRIFSAKDSGAAKKAVGWFVVGVVLIETCISLLGLTGAVAAQQGLLRDLALDGAGSTETVIPALAFELLPTPAGMLLVSCMLAVIVSTADSFLLVPATNLARDVYHLRINAAATGPQIVLVTRLLIVGGGVAAYVLSDRFPTVLAAANTAYLIYGTSITPAVLAAFLWRRATATGAVASIVTGTATTLIWKYGVDKTGFSPLLAEVAYPATFCSVAALVLGSYATAAPPAEVWRKFCDDGEGLELKAAGAGALSGDEDERTDLLKPAEGEAARS